MSMSSSTTRNLTLTEELEKLEQSITLTLQGMSPATEIDHNFSKAHRIVTSGIIPVVEQYARHSEDVWEGSKFWKRFFEASANVSLNSYEEEPLETDVTQTDSGTEHEPSFNTPSREDEQDGIDATITDDRSEQHDHSGVDSSTFESSFAAADVQSTPQLASIRNKKYASPPPPPRSSNTGSSSSRLAFRAKASPDDPSTPRPNVFQKHSAHDSSPFEPLSTHRMGTAQRQNQEPLLHRLLDKNYRIQATPLAIHKPLPSTAKMPSGKIEASFDSSPMTSPELPTLKLGSELGRTPRRRIDTQPRTPGLSIQRPAPTRPDQQVAAKSQPPATARTPALYDSDSDETLSETGAMTDLLGGMSPPKTIHFGLDDLVSIPNGRQILQTPAREASRRIVEDLMSTARKTYDDDEEAQDTFFDDSDEFEDRRLHADEYSPSIVRKAALDDDDAF